MRCSVRSVFGLLVHIIRGIARSISDHHPPGVIPRFRWLSSSLQATPSYDLFSHIVANLDLVLLAPVGCTWFHVPCYPLRFKCLLTSWTRIRPVRVLHQHFGYFPWPRSTTYGCFFCPSVVRTNFVPMDDFFDVLLHWTNCHVSIGETTPFLSVTSVSPLVSDAKPVHVIHYFGLPSFPNAKNTRTLIIGDEWEHHFLR